MTRDLKENEGRRLAEVQKLYQKLAIHKCTPVNLRPSSGGAAAFIGEEAIVTAGVAPFVLSSNEVCQACERQTDGNSGLL